MLNDFSSKVAKNGFVKAKMKNTYDLLKKFVKTSLNQHLTIQRILLASPITLAKMP
jgi:hypothetical protein